MRLPRLPVFIRKRIVATFSLASTAVILVVVGISVFVISLYFRQTLRRHADDICATQLSQMEANLNGTNGVMQERVRAAMNVLRVECSKIGVPSLGARTSLAGREVSALLIGGRNQVQEFSVVDRVKDLVGGTATLFVREADDYIRISTNVKKADGSRAVGTVLDPKGKAYAAIRRGDSFIGVVDILGSPYFTCYEPMKDARDQVIGVWYVGYPIASLVELQKTIESTTILNHGFLALLGGDGRVRFKSAVIAQPDLEKLLSPDAAGPQAWHIDRHTFAPWGYTLVCGYPDSDIEAQMTGVQVGFILAGFVLAAALGTALTILLRRMVVGPLLLVARTMESADLSTQIHSSRIDEIGSFSAAFDRFVGMMRAIVQQVKDTSHSVSASCEEISTNAVQMATGTETQSRQTREVATAMEQVTRTIHENSKTAAATVEAANEARQAAEVGGHAVEDAYTGIQQIAEVVNHSAEAVKELGNSGDQIGEITGVIDDIADQTNLLALNAAIEAARAGEQGRGFAVVADEVRRLAERTTKATKEIAQTIRKIQDDTHQAVETLLGGVHRVDDAIALARKAGESIGQIVESSQKVSLMITQIAAASEQQATAAGQIAKNVEGIDTITNETANGTRQTAKAVEGLTSLTRSLESLVGQFQIEESVPE